MIYNPGLYYGTVNFIGHNQLFTILETVDILKLCNPYPYFIPLCWNRHGKLYISIGIGHRNIAVYWHGFSSSSNLYIF